MDVRQAVVTSLEPIGEPLVIYPHQVHDGGIQVMNVHAVSNDVVAVVVRLPVGAALLYSCPGEEEAEAAGMVIAPVVRLRQRSLAVNRATKFATPDDKSIIQEPTLF